MELAALILSGVSLVLLVLFVFILLNARKDGSAELRMELSNSLQAFGQTISENQRAAAESQDKRLSGMEQNNALDFERLRKSQEDASIRSSRTTNRSSKRSARRWNVG